jgi:pimeloyl-ACP methyl ester carboxylesterase
MHDEECIAFTNSNDLTLRGILHRGRDSAYRRTSLILLNTGLNDMAGWHRIQVKMARHLAQHGYNVLRFDDTGIGDSDGEITEESIVSIFASIETGLFVPNADAAVDYMSKRFQKERLVYVGPCGGALTAIHSAATNRNVAGVIYIGGPATLSSQEYLKKVDPWEVRQNVDKYRSKMLDLNAWLRFVTGRGEYATVFRSIVYFLAHKIRGEYKQTSTLEEYAGATNINEKLFHSYEMYSKSKRPILFYFAEIDSATWEFKKFFLKKYDNGPLWRQGRHTFIEVQGANHIFSGFDSQKKLNADLSDWLHSCLR